MTCVVRQKIALIHVTHVQNDFKIRTLTKQLLTKYQIFTKLPQISHIYKILKFVSIIGDR